MINTFDSESKIIAALLTDKHSGEIMQRLTLQDFSEALHQNVFKAAEALFRANAPVNAHTVARELRYVYEDDGDLDHTLTEYAKTAPSDPDYYITALLSDNALIRYRELGTALSYAQTASEAESAVQAIVTSAGKQTRKNVKSALAAALDFAERLERSAKDPPEYLHWGLEPLDRELYIERGDFVVIGGRPSVGKTMLALQLALHMAQKHSVGFVSLETSTAKLTARALAQLGEVPLWKIKNPRSLSDDEQGRLEKAGQRLSRLKLDFVDGGSVNTAQIQSLAVNRKWEIVFVDYVQIMQGSGKSRYEVVTDISQSLHSMAQSLGVCVIALAQLSRPAKSAAGKEPPPTLESLRESGQLEQDADAVLLLSLSNPADKGSSRELQLAKNKEGSCFACELLFNGNTQTFFYLRKGND